VGSPAPARASQIPAQKASVKPVGRRPRERRTSASRSARGRSARKSGLFGTLRPERRRRGNLWHLRQVRNACPASFVESPLTSRERAHGHAGAASEVGERIFGARGENAAAKAKASLSALGRQQHGVRTSSRRRATRRRAGERK